MSSMDKNLKIIVACGGVSSEREVSLKSGKSVYDALKRLDYPNVVLFDLKRDNMSQLLELEPDVVFIALHGKGGEDGTIQGMLELAGIPYTGPGVAASAVCMNKILTKRLLSNAGLPTAPFLAYCKEDIEGKYVEIEQMAKERIGYPMVLKSPCEGSSIGVVIIRSSDEFKHGIDEVFKYGDELLIEAFVQGVEITLPILGNDKVTVLPIIEITSEREFYDYTAKYTQGLCHHIIPACISSDEEATVIDVGKRAYKVLGCKGISRIDFIIDKIKGPMIIEVNTSPGMTNMSLFPDAARYAGMSYEHLIESILELGWSNR